MNGTRKTALRAVLLSIFAGFAAWIWYATFIAGTTDGPDVIGAIQSGEVAADTISSIEVVEPAVGHTPFTAEENDSLPRRAVIKSPASIRQLLSLLKNSEAGRIHQNHPTSTYRAYLKLNVQDDFFWLHCDVLQDRQGGVLVMHANTRNATNRNGASIYHLDRFSEVLAMFEDAQQVATGAHQ